MCSKYSVLKRTAKMCLTEGKMWWRLGSYAELPKPSATRWKHPFFCYKACLASAAYPASTVASQQQNAWELHCSKDYYEIAVIQSSKAWVLAILSFLGGWEIQYVSQIWLIHSVLRCNTFIWEAIFNMQFLGVPRVNLLLWFCIRGSGSAV